MNRYSIEEILGRVSDKSFDDTELAQAIYRLPDVKPEGPWLAGGALRRTIAGQKLESDFDYFFASQEQFDAFCQQVKDSGGWQKSANEHNVTFGLPSVRPESVGDDEFTKYQPEIEVQAIKIRWYSSIDEVLDSFDFTICQFGYDGEHLVCGEYSLWDLGRKRLVPHRLTYAVASFRRLLKYTRQGYSICGGGLANMLEQVVSDPSVVNADTKYID